MTFSNWMYKVIPNVSTDLLRKQSIRPPQMELTGNIPPNNFKNTEHPINKTKVVHNDGGRSYRVIDKSRDGR